MSRINTNIAAMTAGRAFVQNNTSLTKSMERLSTGMRINKGKDDPAGLIASEALRDQQVSITAAIKNGQRADQVIGTADASLNQINSLLVELEGLVVETSNEAGLSDSEVEANQLQVDSILSSINRIADMTQFEDIKLLNGNLDYVTSGTATQIADAEIHAAKLTVGVPRTIIVDVTQSAEMGQLVFGSAGLASGNNVTLEVAGNLGSEVVSFAGSAAASAIAYAINQLTTVTGVTASATASNVTFESQGYGGDSYVSVQTISGTFAVTGGSGGKDYGRDATVNINGTAATVDGLVASVNSEQFAAKLTLSEAFGTALGTKSFDVVSGGANFAITPDVNSAGIVSLGIASVTTGSIGNADDGALSTLASGQTNSLTEKKFGASQRIVRDAAKQVSTLRGRLGAFQKNTLESTMRSLEITYENITAAESAIRDTDFATETAAMTRSQILVQAGVMTLRMANQLPQNALSLLG